jgi:hypothetical protein
MCLTAPSCLQIRFFERVKLERRLNRLQAQLAAAAKGQPAEGEAQEQEQADPAELQRQVAAVQEDLQYVLNFPKGEKYVSLLRQAEDPGAQVGGWVDGWVLPWAANRARQGLQGRAMRVGAGSTGRPAKCPSAFVGVLHEERGPTGLQLLPQLEGAIC